MQYYFFRVLLTFSNTHAISWVIGSFSNDDSDGNQDVKKAIGLLRKTTTLHVHHAFLYISSRSLHDYDVKMPNGCGPQEINSWEIRLHLPFSANWNKRDKDWKNGEFILKLKFSLRLPSSMLKLPVASLTEGTSSFIMQEKRPDSFFWVLKPWFNLHSRGLQWKHINWLIRGLTSLWLCTLIAKW